MELKFGRVVWFDKVKGYGFVKPDGEDVEIFLHFGDGRALEIRNSEIAFSKLDVPYDLPYPKAGESLCFLVSRGSKGRPKCFPWCFSTKYAVVNDYIERERNSKFQIGNVDQFEFEKCDCGHYIYEHCGGKCQARFCHCGDEDYEEDVVITSPDRRQGILVTDYNETNLGDTPGGPHVYE